MGGPFTKLDNIFFTIPYAILETRENIKTLYKELDSATSEFESIVKIKRDKTTLQHPHLRFRQATQFTFNVFSWTEISPL